MVFYSELLTYVVAGLAVLLAIFASRRPALRSFETPLLLFVGLVGVVASVNFGWLHHYRDDGFVNRWEQFHYQLGSKYFPELRYDGLYAASLGAQAQTAPKLPTGDTVRDLTINRVRTIESHEALVESVRGRFSDERWNEFLRDHHVYLESTPKRMWRSIRRDHGYNPTPAWTVVARIFSTQLPTGYASLVWLGMLDIVLLAGAAAMLTATYGLRVGCLALAIAGLGYGWQYIYIGAFLRLDWLAATVAAVCLLKRERFALAGACLAYAGLVRIFPLALLAGPALHALAEALRGERPRWALRFGAGFTLTCAGAIALTALLAPGLESWPEFASRITAHVAGWSTNRVGLSSVLLYDPGFLFANLFEPLTPAEPEALIAERLWLRGLLAAGLCGLALRAMLRVARDQSVVVGAVLVFALSSPTAYYWILLMLVPLVSGRRGTLVLVGGFTALYALSLAFPGYAYVSFRFALMSWGLMFAAIAWTLALGRRETAAG